MARFKEQKLWDAMKRNLPKSFWMQRIENVVGEGIPDVYVAAPRGKYAWVELKAPIAPKKATTRLLGTEGLRKSQINWHIKAARKGTRSFILIRDDVNNMFLIPSYLADKINEMTAGELQAVSVADTWREIEKEITR